MIGVLANCATVILGCTLGLLFKKGIPDRMADALMKCIGFITVYIGVTGLFEEGTMPLVVIVSMVLGTLIGEIIDIDKWLTKLGNKVEQKFSKNEGSTVAEGFVTSSLLFCVGAMTIVGSLQAGLTGDNTTLFTKAALDLISSTILASTLGIGVMFSVITVLVLQGGIVLLARALQPVLTDVAVANMTVVGSLLILALAVNLLKIGKVKTANMLPAIILPTVLCPLFSLLGM